MNFSIPIYVDVKDAEYHVRPLFFPHARASADMLGRAMSRLTNSLRDTLISLGEDRCHDALAACTFSPDLRQNNVNVNVEAAGRVLRMRLLVVSFDALDRRVVHVPAFPAVWFDLDRGERLESRVEQMVGLHLRERVKNDEDITPPSGRAWLTSIDINYSPPLKYEQKAPDSDHAILGHGQMNGSAELRRVGRRLDDLYPDDLARSILREREVKRLMRALELQDRRPVLVRGARRVGKSALVHEVVYQRNESAGRTADPMVGGLSRRKRNGSAIWLIAPQRLISGMQFVGQWESRLIAILEHTRDHAHVLYFDDLLGLFSAGRSAGSDLTVAQVLKPFIERREVRILGEITPAGFRLLQEYDRGLADTFEVVSLEETPLPTTFRILLDGVRRAEAAHKMRFTPESVGQIVDLQRRYVRDAVFPGKACVFAQHLAARHRDGEVTREAVLDEFNAVSGLSLQMLDDQRKLPREEVRAALQGRIIGQDAALDAMADAVAVAKARIGDSTRPLASLLFLGPTGVGKTQCARALAAFLFGDENRLLRFDMNEFVAPGAAARLVGTFASPGGLLTSAVRQMPFCVLLLDEIEKAHPEVFNLMLQVMGDGRLTDALGRTVDFTHAIIIMTSNLGVRETARPIGFRGGHAQDTLVYRRAAEQFFAPEFFNRLDRIVPFHALSREDVEHIARLLMARVLVREGLVRRQCILQLDRRAFEAIVAEGYHAVLGARALKRAVERHVAHPIANRLAGMAPSGATIIALFANPHGVTASIHPLRQVRAFDSGLPPPGASLEGLASRVEQRIADLEERLAARAPAGPVSSDGIELEQMHYFRVRHGLEEARRLLRRVASRHTPPTGPPRRRKTEGPRRRLLPVQCMEALTDLLLVPDLRGRVRHLASAAGVVEPVPGQVDKRVLAAALLRDVALLHVLSAGAADEEALVWVRGLDDGDPTLLDGLADVYTSAGESWLDFEVRRLDVPPIKTERALSIRGAAAAHLMHAEHGTHLFLKGEQLQPLSVVVQRVAPGTSMATLGALRAGRAQWLDALASGEASVEDAPHPIGDVLRVYDEAHALDLRSGLVLDGPLDAAGLRELILGGLE